MYFSLFLLLIPVAFKFTLKFLLNVHSLDFPAMLYLTHTDF